MSNESISAFAFKTGKLIEDLINIETNNIKAINQLLEGLILSYRHKLLNMSHPDFNALREIQLKDFDKHFNINHDREGEI